MSHKPQFGNLDTSRGRRGGDDTPAAGRGDPAAPRCFPEGGDWPREAACVASDHDTERRIALSSVATGADREQLMTVRIAANPQSKNNFTMNRHRRVAAAFDQRSRRGDVSELKINLRVVLSMATIVGQRLQRVRAPERESSGVSNLQLLRESLFGLGTVHRSVLNGIDVFSALQLQTAVRGQLDPVKDGQVDLEHEASDLCRGISPRDFSIGHYEPTTR